jgi:hypothetical protein
MYMMVRCVIYKHNRDLSVINNLFVTHIWTHVCDIYAIEKLNLPLPKLSTNQKLNPHL